jgi:hypothetical protein
VSHEAQGAENIWTEEEDITESWRKLYNNELHYFYPLLFIEIIIFSVSENEVASACNTHERNYKCLQIYGPKAPKKETNCKA